ncbi:MAG: tRNA pseudouridine(38-40) synthase TruA [Magnetococcales bacterium]|nr:tRNA pseudouridine(38-40) synthase TruA [Magnetococcales bacterium]
MQRYRLLLEYNGTRFRGWQRQLGHPTVQESLETALARLCGHQVTVTGAGRTDTGVHALGQVAHFDTHRPRPAGELKKALNALTPKDVAVLAVEEVDSRFHARFSACYREYLYRLNDRQEPPVLELGRVWHLHQRVDAGLMNQAASLLLGQHDFTAFRAAGCQAKSPVREVKLARVSRQGHEIRLEIGANAFLQHMVRNIIGSLVMVGRGEWSVDHFGKVLAGGDRTRAGATAPPHGLYFMRVDYPPLEG